jgi:hypothetical protein
MIGLYFPFFLFFIFKGIFPIYNYLALWICFYFATALTVIRRLRPHFFVLIGNQLVNARRFYLRDHIAEISVENIQCKII